MDSVVLSDRQQWQIEKKEIPKAKAGEVVVKILAAGVCGTDVEIFDGTLGYFESGLSSYPLTPGHEWCGTIHEAGAGCDASLKQGQLVVGETSVGCGEDECSFCPAAYNRCPKRTETGVVQRDGGFAQYMAIPASAVHVVPDGVPVDVAVLAEPLAVCVHAVAAAGNPKEKFVVVYGDGPIGLLLLQVLKNAGNKVVVVGAIPERLQLAEELGADALLDARPFPITGIINFLKQVSDDDSLPDVVFEASGNPQAIEFATQSSKPGGHVVLVGLTGGEKVPLPVDAWVLNEIQITGVVSALHDHWEETVKLLASEAIKTIVSDKLPLSGYGDAIEKVRERAPGLTKVIIEPHQE